MAKSKIIKDLANGLVDTKTALKRAKILLQDFEDDHLIQWVNYELYGYPDDAILPDYRVTSGQLRGSYFKGSIATHIKYTKVPLPLGKMPVDTAKELLSVKFYEGVEALSHLIASSGNPVVKQLPADFYPYIAKCNNDLYMNITSAYVEFGSHEIQSVLSAVEGKLLDIFCYLEKNFGNLDELDIDLSSKESSEITNIVQHISMIIFNDYSVTIGDNNRIKGSSIASSIQAKD